LVLAVGLVVDDAIVMLENTYRHIEAGMSPMDAAKVGSQEIGFAIIAMTLCLVAVYVPAGFMHGNIAIFFREFAFTLAASVLISGFVALTLSPMMCARILPDGNHLGRLEKWLNAHFTTWRNAYKKRLSFVIAHRWYLVGLFVVLLAVGAHFFRALPRGLLPKNEIGFVISQISGPGSVNPTYVFNNMKRLMAHVNATPELNKSLHAYASFAGGSGMGGQNSAIALMQLNTGVNASAFAMALSKYMSGMPQVSGGAFVYNMNGGNGLSDKGAVRFAVQGMTSYKQLAVASNLLVNVLKKDPHFRDVESSLHFNTQQYNLHINRALANQLNVPITNITNTLQIYFAGYQLQQEYNYNGVDYPIVMQLPRKKLKDFSVLSSIYVLSRSGNPVKLSRFVTETPDLTIAERSHSQRMRNGVVSLNLNDNYDMGNAVSDIQAAAARVLPGGIEIQFWGAAQKYLQQGSDITLIFVLGLLFIYLVLAALFESFIDPFIILLTVPLCVVGAIIALYIMGGELNLYTGIGLVTLIGLVSKHGVLITQFANARVAEGKSAQDAVVEAAGIRLRPILMTTATMCLGALPLVFASGSGSSGRIQIGVVIVAGLLIGTLFSLFVVPVAYTLFAHIKRQVK
jgi:multidrug efflux pump subunit AcrB